ncbi:MAG: hypothetical protein EOP04_27940, partial [Proteobacteria bacterium]
MINPTTPLPPWNNQTELFDHPIVNCELVLDGQNRMVSMVLWENYCYLKVEGLNGLWGITRPYDGSDVAKFASESIEQGEVGRVWTFSYAFLNIDYITQPYLASSGKLPPSKFPSVRLVAIVRFNNSALVRQASTGPFYETPPLIIERKRGGKNKANIPSIWSPARQLIGHKHIGSLARSVSHPPVTPAELFTWKNGSLPEAVTLLEALYFFASEDRIRYRSGDPIQLHWPLLREHLVFSAYGNQKNLTNFLQVIWEQHHFDTNHWLPANDFHYSAVTNKRNEWRKATENRHLTLRRNIFATAHEQMEAALMLHDFFNGKVSDEELNELLK